MSGAPHVHHFVIFGCTDDMSAVNATLLAAAYTPSKADAGAPVAFGPNAFLPPNACRESVAVWTPGQDMFVLPPEV